MLVGLKVKKTGKGLFVPGSFLLITTSQEIVANFKTGSLVLRNCALTAT